MREKLVAEPGTLAGTANESGDVIKLNRRGFEDGGVDDGGERGGAGGGVGRPGPPPPPPRESGT
jgi:hypothetical protein